MSRLLLLEDDGSLVDGLRYALQKEFEVTAAGTVKEAKQYLRNMEFSILLLDVTLPDGTGFEICEALRSRGDQTPVIFLTASDDEMNVVRGLDGGGDDYITKPFRLGELMSRIHALLRRTGRGKEPETAFLSCGDIRIDLAASSVFQGGEKLELTQAEYRLLCLLVRANGRVVTRDMILGELWDGAGSFVDDNTLSVYIRRLREKTEKDPSSPEHLLTARGFGYYWKA